MAKVSAKGCVIALDDSGGDARTISTDVESFEVVWSVDEVEVTGLNESVHNFTPGMAVNSVTLNVYWNTAATTGAWTVIRGIIGSTTGKTLTITPESGGVALSGEFMCAGVSITGDPSSAIKLGAVKFLPMGGTVATWA